MNKIIIFNYFFLAILAFIFPFYYGFRGIFPLDSFLIFNGGYNIFNGFYPFKDYWTITGPLLDYIQYFIFLFFDINRKTYVLHASIINVLVTLISFFFFCKLGLNYKYSLLYCAGISVLGYSQTGTPFMDHHAFMFTFISSLYLLLAVKFEKKIDFENLYMQRFN